LRIKEAEASGLSENTSELDTGRLEACLANSTCFTALAMVARKVGDGCSCSTALDVTTGEELERFLGAMLKSSVVSDHR